MVGREGGDGVFVDGARGWWGWVGFDFLDGWGVLVSSCVSRGGGGLTSGS